MTHPGHEVAQASAAGRRERVARMAQIMKMLAPRTVSAGAFLKEDDMAQETRSAAAQVLALIRISKTDKDGRAGIKPLPRGWHLVAGTGRSCWAG